MLNYSNIKEDFIKVIEYSQGFTPNNEAVNKVFAEWAKNKYWMYEALDHKLIWESEEEVSFTLSDIVRENKFREMARYIYDRYGNTELSDYIMGISSLIKDNVVPQDYLTSKGHNIKSGMKLGKSFKFFIENPTVLEDVQNYASRIFQEQKITGKLCFSIHPLDFLSVSENTYNWRSCHALDGEYRAGNLSYMMDGSTFICYLKGADGVKLPRFPEDVLWNNKKWRVLLFMSEDKNLMMAGRPYPFKSENGMEEVMDKLHYTKLLGRDKWTEWLDGLVDKVNIGLDRDLHFETPYIPIGSKLLPLDMVIKNEGAPCHYNDLLYSSVYKPVFVYRCREFWYSPTERTDIMGTKIYVGHDVPCLYCGEDDCYEGNDSMMCRSCTNGSDYEDSSWCEHCDRRIPHNEDGYWVDDIYICEDCFEQYTAVCENCGTYHLYRNMYFDEKNNVYYCKHCQEIREQEINIEYIFEEE